MSPLVFSLGIGLAVLCLAASAAFVWTSIQERAPRAAAVTGAAGLILATLLLLPLGVDFPHRAQLYTGLLALLGLIGLALALPLSTPRPVRAPGPISRVDERDAVFHRFYRLEPNTPPYETYYAQHPELKNLDDRIRSEPQLGAPGSRHYHPVTSSFQAASFDLLEHLTRSLDAPPSPPPPGAPQPHAPPADLVAPEGLTRHMKGYARYLGAADVGCAPLDQAFVYSHNARGEGAWGDPIRLQHTHAIVFTVEMRHDMVAQAPAGPTFTESATRYLESATIAWLLARVLQRLGYDARAHVDGNYRVLLVPLAVAAGLGELGRIGLLITPKLGPRVRIAAVTTNAPLVPDAPIDFGAAAFCDLCEKCADACPSGSIPHGPRTLDNGVERWVLRRDTCYRYWRTQGTDCALCLRVCPYAHPATLPHQGVRALIRRNGLARRLALWGDDLCYGRRPAPSPPAPDWHRPS